jgi:hypothetical protein
MKVALKWFVTMFLAIGLLFAPGLQAQQQSQTATPQNVPVPVQGNGPAPPPTVGLAYSPAVVTTSTATLVQTLNKLNVQTATAGDIQSAATALQITFASLQETGANAQFQAWILANASLIESYSPTPTAVNNLYVSLTNSGAVVSLDDVQNMLSVSAQEAQEFVSQVKQNGMASMEAQIVTALQQAATTVGSRGSMVQVAYQRNSKTRARLLLIDCANNALAAGALAVGAGLLGAEPVAAVFGLVALTYGIFHKLALC